jgi:hypothetical protein
VEYINGDYGKGLLVILGAGASYDAVSGMSVDRRPPLTNGLVTDTQMTKEILKKYPAATAVYDFLDRETKGSQWGDKAQSLEEALRRYQSRAVSNPRVVTQMTAFRFYLRDLLFRAATNVVEERSGVTNYVTLARECIQWARETSRIVCFVSFNYDPLLEWALQEIDGFDPLGMPNYSSGPDYYVLKPHGSILWNWPDVTQVFQNDNTAMQYAIDDGKPQDLVDPEISISASPVYRVKGQATGHEHCCYPAIALPFDRDKVFVWPTEQDNLFADAAAVIGGRTFSNGVFGRVLSIGWRGSEPHFLGRLTRLVSPTADLWTVTQGDSSHDEVVDALRGVLPGTGVVYRENGFGGFLDDMALSSALDW